MDPKYIFAIVALSLFFVLFIIFFAMLARKRRMEARLQAWLYEVYSDKNLIKMDYDSADEDEPVQSVTVSAADASPAQDEKKEAEEAGWSGGNVERYTGEGTAIGGSRFGNREGLLPKEQGRVYTECDIDTVGENSRGAKRIVFSNDGLVYYTDDHYESFELLYGEP